jgi:hypothetical protein
MADRFQASWALYDALENLMKDEKTLRLPHDEIENLLEEKRQELVRQLYLDYLASSDKPDTDQATEAYVDEQSGEEPVDDSDLASAYGDASSPEAEPDDEVPTTVCEGTTVCTGASGLAIAQAAYQFTEPSSDLFKCTYIARIVAADDDIPMPPTLAGRHKSEFVGNRWPTVISGGAAVVSQIVNEARSRAPLPDLPCRQKPVWHKVYTINNIAPRAA